MKKHVYCLLILTIFKSAGAQQRNSALTARQQRILMIQQGTHYTFNEAETVLRQQEAGLLLCAGGAVTIGATAALWAFLGYHEQSLTPLGAEVCNCCCRTCTFATFALCSLGCCATCDC